MMKKITAILMAVLLGAALVLGGCSSGKSDRSDNSQNSGSQGSGTEKPGIVVPGGDGDGDGDGDGGDTPGSGEDTPGSGTQSDGYMAGTPGAGTDSRTLQVSMFCSSADAEINRRLCDDWMAKYNKAHGTDYRVKLNYMTDRNEYFTNLDRDWANNNVGDIIYISPRYVRSYAETGRVLDLSRYLDVVSADPALSGNAAKALNQESFGQIWKNPLSYYSFIRGRATGANAYTMGQPVSYDAAQNKLYTDEGHEEAGLYGLPKDYQSFSLGYNRNFFTPEMKKALTTTLPNEERNVRGAKGDSDGELASGRKYTADTGLRQKFPAEGVVQYAAGGEYTNPYDGGKTMTATAGGIAPIINIGVPTTYFPFNFFRFNTYYEALEGKDPVALLCEEYTGGQGYTVTIPGFPDETFEVTDSKDPNALYDSSMGHIVYTYAEYSALIWAMTYYLNTFDWQPVTGGEADGYGGVPVTAGGRTEHCVIYGGEQHEGLGGINGSTLYLLPWLFGNDANIINDLSASCASVKSGKVVEMNDMSKINIQNPEDWRKYAGDSADVLPRMNLDGTTRYVGVQYGYNSENFIETYGAFLALASDWNANNTGDSDGYSTASGWSQFCAGRCIFNGAGSWDAATRNDIDPDILTFGQIPTPVSENYALYSRIKGANYEMVTYSNGATAKGSGIDANDDKIQRIDLAEGLQIYDAAAICTNQLLRQDKWGAYTDSLGFAVNGQVAHYTADHAWKIEAAVSLVMALTIGRDAQAELTYTGTQFPIFMDRMQEFVDYQKYGAEGAFKDMLTPEGFSDMQYYNDDGTVNETVAAEAKVLWEAYYDIAREMEKAALAGDSRTVQEFLSQVGQANVGGRPLRYNTAYNYLRLCDFRGNGSANLAYAMKVLNMVTLTRSDRELNLRIQCGLNAVRDSTMFTYSDSWIQFIDASGYPDSMFAYRKQAPLTALAGSIKEIVKTNPANEARMFETPAVFCFKYTGLAYNSLLEAYGKEEEALKKYQNQD